MVVVVKTGLRDGSLLHVDLLLSTNKAKKVTARPCIYIREFFFYFRQLHIEIRFSVFNKTDFIVRKAKRLCKLLIYYTHILKIS